MKVRYYGHVGFPSGYGDAANETCMAILEAGYQLEISTNGTQLEKRFFPLAGCVRAPDELTDPDVVVIHTLPLDCGRLLEQERIRERFPAAKLIAYTTWEGASPVSSAVADALRPFSQVWVPSSQNRSAMYNGDLRLAVAVPHAYDPAVVDDLSVLDEVPSRYRFLYVGAWNGRKNVPGLIRAFARAFTKHDNVELVIHSTNAAQAQVDIARLSCGVPLEGMAPIILSSERISDRRMWEVIASAHCFVTATRGEAWNLPAFNAMLMQCHIIAPAGQGSDDFLDGTSACQYEAPAAPFYGDVVATQRADTPAGYGTAQFHGPQGMSCRDDWWEPNTADLAVRMRRAYVEGIDQLKLFYDPAERFGRSAVAGIITQLLEG